MLIFREPGDIFSGVARRLLYYKGKNSVTPSETARETKGKLAAQLSFKGLQGLLSRQL
jgi:hypothetical protein